MTTLDGVYAKLDRANFHARHLKVEIGRALEPYRWEVVREADGLNKYIFRVSRAPEIPTQWSLILGDFLTNLRAALDHLAWQLVLRDGNQPARGTSFPIQERNVNGNGASTPARIRGVKDPEVASSIEAVQPYSEPDAMQSPLMSLNQLVNIDKHRLLLVVTHALDFNRIWWGSNKGDPSPTFSINTGPLKVGDVVASFEFGDQPAAVTFDPHLELDIRLNDGPNVYSVRHVSLLDLVAMLYMTVEHDIVGFHFASYFGLGPRHYASAFAIPN